MIARPGVPTPQLPAFSQLMAGLARTRPVGEAQRATARGAQPRHCCWDARPDFPAPRLLVRCARPYARPVRWHGTAGLDLALLAAAPLGLRPSITVADDSLAGWTIPSPPPSSSPLPLSL